MHDLWAAASSQFACTRSQERAKTLETKEQEPLFKEFKKGLYWNSILSIQTSPQSGEEEWITIMGSLIFLLKINKFHKLLKLRIKVPRVSFLDEYFTKSFPRQETKLFFFLLSTQGRVLQFPPMTFVGAAPLLVEKQNWFTKEWMRKNAGNIHKTNVLVWHRKRIRRGHGVLGCYQLAKGTWHFWCCVYKKWIYLMCRLAPSPSQCLLRYCGAAEIPSPFLWWWIQSGHVMWSFLVAPQIKRWNYSQVMSLIQSVAIKRNATPSLGECSVLMRGRYEEP